MFYLAHSVNLYLSGSVSHTSHYPASDEPHCLFPHKDICCHLVDDLLSCMYALPVSFGFQKLATGHFGLHFTQ